MLEINEEKEDGRRKRSKLYHHPIRLWVSSFLSLTPLFVRPPGTLATILGYKQQSAGASFVTRYLPTSPPQKLCTRFPFLDPKSTSNKAPSLNEPPKKQRKWTSIPQQPQHKIYSISATRSPPATLSPTLIGSATSFPGLGAATDTSWLVGRFVFLFGWDVRGMDGEYMYRYVGGGYCPLYNPHRPTDHDPRTIFIALSTRSGWPFLTCCPTFARTSTTSPGMGAPTLPALPASDLGRTVTYRFLDDGGLGLLVTNAVLCFFCSSARAFVYTLTLAFLSLIFTLRDWPLS